MSGDPDDWVVTSTVIDVAVSKNGGLTVTVEYVPSDGLPALMEAEYVQLRWPSLDGDDE